MKLSLNELPSHWRSIAQRSAPGLHIAADMLEDALAQQAHEKCPLLVAAQPAGFHCAPECIAQQAQPERELKRHSCALHNSSLPCARCGEKS